MREKRNRETKNRIDWAECYRWARIAAQNVSQGHPPCGDCYPDLSKGFDPSNIVAEAKNAFDEIK